MMEDFDPSYGAPFLTRRERLLAGEGYGRFDPAYGSAPRDLLKLRESSWEETIDPAYGAPARATMNALNEMGCLEVRLHYLSLLYAKALQPTSKMQRRFVLITLSDGFFERDEVYEVEVPVVSSPNREDITDIRKEIAECREQLRIHERKINDSLSETFGIECGTSNEKGRKAHSFTVYDYAMAKRSAWQGNAKVRIETPDVLTSYA